MVSFASSILLTNEGGNEIYGFNAQTQTFKTMFSDVNFQIDAMCSTEHHLYIFQKKSPHVIHILDSKFQSVGYIPTGFKEKSTFFLDCQLDLCSSTMTVNESTQGYSSSGFKTRYQHLCIISMSKPAALEMSPHFPIVRPAPWYPSVRAVNEAGVVWQLDSLSYSELDNRFNPRSVSTSATGDVFIADNGADRVSESPLCSE